MAKDRKIPLHFGLANVIYFLTIDLMKIFQLILLDFQAKERNLSHPSYYRMVGGILLALVELQPFRKKLKAGVIRNTIIG